jgi:hypothetical protein
MVDCSIALSYPTPHRHGSAYVVVGDGMVFVVLTYPKPTTQQHSTFSVQTSFSIQASWFHHSLPRWEEIQEHQQRPLLCVVVRGGGGRLIGAGGQEGASSDVSERRAARRNDEGTRKHPNTETLPTHSAVAHFLLFHS